jgi:hypothetical protein
MSNTSPSWRVTAATYIVLLDGKTDPVATDASSLTLVAEYDNDDKNG